MHSASQPNPRFPAPTRTRTPHLSRALRRASLGVAPALLVILVATELLATAQALRGFAPPPTPGSYERRPGDIGERGGGPDGRRGRAGRLGGTHQARVLASTLVAHGDHMGTRDLVAAEAIASQFGVLPPIVSLVTVQGEPILLGTDGRVWQRFGISEACAGASDRGARTSDFGLGVICSRSPLWPEATARCSRSLRTEPFGPGPSRLAARTACAPGPSAPRGRSPPKRRDCRRPWPRAHAGCHRHGLGVGQRRWRAPGPGAQIRPSCNPVPWGPPPRAGDRRLRPTGALPWQMTAPSGPGTRICTRLRSSLRDSTRLLRSRPAEGIPWRCAAMARCGHGARTSGDR